MRCIHALYEKTFYDIIYIYIPVYTCRSIYIGVPTFLSDWIQVRRKFLNVDIL